MINNGPHKSLLTTSNIFDDLILQGKKKSQDLVEPTSKQLDDYKKEVLSFIKEKNRPIYGGTAIHFILKSAGYEKGIYDSEYEYDYDFYTPDPINDSIELCDRLYKKGYPFVKRIVGISGLVFRVQVNTDTNIADIGYYPQNYFDRLPTFKASNGVTCVHPEYLRIDLYGAMTDSPRSLYRWGKDYQRLQLLEHFFPIKIMRFGGDNIKNTDISKDRTNIINKVIKYIGDHQNEIILTGKFAYNYYISLINKNINKVGGSSTEDYSGELQQVILSDIAMLSIDPEKTGNALMKVLKEKGQSLGLKHYSGYMKILAKHCIIYLNDIPVVYIFGAITPVHPYIKIKHNGNSYKIHDLFSLLHLFHTLKIVYPEHDHNYINYIVNLKIAAQKYKNIKGLKELDRTNPFQIMIVDGLETNYDAEVKIRFGGKDLNIYMPELVEKLNKKIEVRNYTEYYAKEIDPNITPYEITDHIDEESIESTEEME